MTNEDYEMRREALAHATNVWMRFGDRVDGDVTVVATAQRYYDFLRGSESPDEQQPDIQVDELANALGKAICGDASVVELFGVYGALGDGSFLSEALREGLHSAARNLIDSGYGKRATS